MSDNQPVVVTPAEASVLPQNSSKAIVSLVFGILGFNLLPLIGPIVALAVGYSAKQDIKASRGRLNGDGMATAGIVLGWVNVGLWIFGICVWVVIALGFFTVLGNVQ